MGVFASQNVQSIALRIEISGILRAILLTSVWRDCLPAAPSRQRAVARIRRLISRRREPSSELPARMQGRDSMRRGAGRLAGTIGNAAASFAGWQQLKGSISRMNCLASDSRTRT